MSRKELLCWYFALCECIKEGPDDHLFPWAFRWADSVYCLGMDVRTRAISKRYDRMMTFLKVEDW